MPTHPPEPISKDAECRTNRRNARALATAASNVAAKGLNGAVSLASVPLTLHYLGPERFGLWMTLASLQAVFSFADFGLGNGVLHTVSEAFGHGDIPLISQIVRLALLLQTGVVTTLLALFWVVHARFNWASLLHITDVVAAREAEPALFIFVLIFCIRSIVQVVQQAQYGEQRGYISSAWTACGNLAALVGVFVAAHRHWGVPALCLVVSGLPVLAGICNAGWWLFAHRSPSIPLRRTPKSVVARTLRLGILFFAMQVAATINVGIDPLIVNQALGPKAVATFSLVQKPFDLLAILLLLLLQPLWPAYTEAIASGDTAWVRSTFRRVLTATLLLSSLAAIVMAVAGKTLIRLWAGETIQPPEALIFAYCAAHLFQASQAPLAYFFNGLGKIRFQLFLAIPVICGSVALKLLLAPRFGLAALPGVTVLIGVTFALPIQLAYLRRIKNRDLAPNAPPLERPIAH